MKAKIGWTNREIFRDVDLRGRFVLYNKVPQMSSNKRLLIYVAQNGFFVSGRIMREDKLFVQVEKCVKYWTRSIPFSKKGLNLVPFSPVVSFGSEISKIPYSIIETAGSFFRQVHRIYNTEAMVQLLYSESKNDWMIRALPQRCAYSSVIYDLNYPLPEDYSYIGVIHSHNIFSAYHSATDDTAEKKIDGIYITLGDVNRPSLSISTSVVVCGVRIVVDGMTLIETPTYDFPDCWLDSVFNIQNNGR